MAATIKKRMITVRLSERQHLDLKVSLAKDGNTIQRMITEHIDWYISKISSGPVAFPRVAAGPEEDPALSEGDYVESGKRPRLGSAVAWAPGGGESTEPLPSTADSESAGCQDHPGTPKPWCLNCQREKGKK